jgi:drug/metabolite transporter (DMT)-like permease
LSQRLDLTGVASMCVAMLVGLVMELLPRYLSRAYSPYEIVWIRYGTHLALMLLLWAPADPRRLARTRHPGLHAVRALTMLVMPVTFVVAITRYPMDAVLAVFWIQPLMATAFAAVGLRERVPLRWWVAGGVAYAGSLMLYPPARVLRADLLILPLAMAACFALYQVLTRAMREEPTVVRLFYTALGVWVPLSVAVPWFWTTPTPRDLVLMMTVGVLGYVALFYLDRALDEASVAKVAPFVLVQPVAGVFLEAAVHARRPALTSIAGVAVVLVAWVVLAWRKRAP